MSKGKKKKGKNKAIEEIIEITITEESQESAPSSTVAAAFLAGMIFGSLIIITALGFLVNHF